MLQAKAPLTIHNTSNTLPTRADWQYLLPLPKTGKVKHLHYLGKATAAPIKTLQEIGENVTVGESIANTYDLLIVHHQQSPKARLYKDIIKENGVLLLEVQRQLRRPWKNHPYGIITSLKSQGLTLSNIVWVAPNFEQPKRYLPIDSTPVLRWYFQSLFIVGSLPGYAGKKLLSQFPQLLRHVIPCYIIIATNKGDPNQNHPLINLSATEPATHTAILTSGFDSGSRTVLLPFEKGNGQPQSVIKVANTSTLNTYTHQEQETLRTLHQKLPLELKKSIPQPLGISHYNGKTVRSETPAQGIPLWTLLQDFSTTLHQKLEILQRASQWITQFHKTMTKEPINTEIFLERWMQPVVNTYQKHFDTNTSINNLFNTVLKYTDNLKGQTLPLVWQHFDYSPWNIYQNKKHLTVIDWEFGRTTQTDTYGPPLCDLVYFIKYWLHAVQRTKTTDEELNTFHFLLYTGKVKTGCQTALNTYCRTLGISTKWIPILTVYTWMEQAIHQVERQTLQGYRAYTPNKAQLYVDALAKHQHILFTT